MIVDFALPELGKEVPNATIITWCKSVGETVAKDDVLLEVMSEKVNIEVTCDIEGKLVEILVPADDEITPGTVIARLDTAA